MLIFKELIRLSSRQDFVCRVKRFISITSQRTTISLETYCEAWQLHSYGDLEEVKRCTVRTPVLTRPDQVLIKVNAASVNPLDVAIIGGYGAATLNVLRQAEKCSNNNVPEFPLTLGRDFAGTVIAKGQGVDAFSIGDEVWGVVSPHLQGSHAQLVVAPSACVAKKPANFSMIEAGSMIYAAMTAWASLQVTGGLAVLGATGKKVLVLGGSGGVGTMAVQLLQGWGASVTATCAADAVPLVQALGVHCVLDYSLPDFHQRLSDTGKYEVILDCAGLGTDGSRDYLKYLSENPLAKFITLKSPLLREIDGKGMVGGALSSLASLIQANLQPGLLPRLAPVRWAFFLPLPPALRDITTLASQGKLKPCIDAVFNFEDVPKALLKLQNGHVRGKIVIKVV